MDWPEDDNKAASFTDLAQPVVDALKATYRLEPRDPEFTQDIPWTGLPMPKSMLACCYPFEVSLTAAALKRNAEEQDRPPVNVIIGIAIQLGIEQGRRAEREDRAPYDRIDELCMRHRILTND